MASPPPLSVGDSDTMSSHVTTTPARIVLQYRDHIQFNRQLSAMINAFFDCQHIQIPNEEYRSNICFGYNPHSSKLYLVLDLWFKTHPQVDLASLPLQVFKVTGSNPLYFPFL